MAKTAGGVRQTRPKSVAARAKDKIMMVLSDIRRQGFSRISPFKIGSVEKRMSDFAGLNGIKLGSKDVYMSSSAIAHATRDSKQAKGLTVSDADLASFPSKRKNMDLYYDTDVKTFLYVGAGNKYAIHPNYEIKLAGGKKKIVNFVTAQKLSDKEMFNGKRYKKK